jgi:hypothetical protein
MLFLLLAARRPPPASSWPLFFNGSGTTQLSSAFGADVLLSPSSTGAAARAAPALRIAHAARHPSRSGDG